MKNDIIKLVQIVFVLMLLSFRTSCDKNDDSVTPSYPNQIIISNDLFYESPDDEFIFTEVEIIGDSLKFTINYGGGCGDIELKLVASEEVMESSPVQRNIRLSLKDEDDCEAIISKEISFDLTPIRLDNDNKVILNLARWDSPLLYEY